MKEEEESGLEERRAREQLGEGVEVRIHSFERSVGRNENWHEVPSTNFFRSPNLTTSYMLITCSGGTDLHGAENRQHLVSG